MIIRTRRYKGVKQYTMNGGTKQAQEDFRTLIPNHKLDSKVFATNIFSYPQIADIFHRKQDLIFHGNCLH